MTNEVLQTAHLLFSPGQVVEVRAITDEGLASGYFDSPEALAAKVDAMEGLPGVQGIYVTLNRVNPALLARRANRVKMRLGKKDATTADDDIVQRQWLPVDVDPSRPSGVSSTEDEHRAAIGRARQVAEYLAGMGWPAPLLADSGNGAHLLYRVDLPNDDEARDLVKRCLEMLAAMFSDGTAGIDTANYNAARIWKLYGTMCRKGDHTADRPHRRATIIDAPDVARVVARELLERLAIALPVALAANSRQGKPLDLSRWLSDHGIGVHAVKPYQGGTLHVLDGCPFSGAHNDGAFAIQFENGAIYAGCHHASCGSGAQRWPELRKRYEPDKSGSVRPPPRISPVEDEPGTAEALEILQHGNPKQAMMQAFSLDHEGDETVAECLIMSLASRSVVNTSGLHVSVTGESGKGKSHAFSTMLQQVPERFRLAGAMSNKALFYIDDLQPGMAIVLDDTVLSEDMAGILKGVTTSFRRPFIYRTVNRDRKGQVCTIPERCVWWMAKVEGSGDDQVFNRMLTCWIDDTPAQDERVLARILLQHEALPAHGIREREEILTCRAMWEVLGQQRLHVTIPFASRIRFQARENRRNPEMLLDLVKAHALLRFMQRSRQEVDGVPCITATREDFDEAVSLYGLLNSTSGGQTTKLTKKESDLIATIERSKWAEFTIPMLQKATGLSNGALHRIIHGYSARGASYTGLLEKCPAIAYTDRTVVTDDMETGASMRRRTNAYIFDQEIFRRWCSGGAVWIEEEVGGDDDQSFNPSTSFTIPSTHVEGQESENMDADSQLTGSNTHMCVYDPHSFNKSRNTGCVESTQTPESVHTRKPGSVEGQDLKTSGQPQIREEGPEIPGKPLQQLLKDSLITPNFVEGVEGPQVKVRAADFKKLALPEGRISCYACGKKGVWYVEKWSSDREKRKKEPARCICRKCYEAAMRRDRAAAPPLPGVISLARMERCATDIGRCSVCDLGKAVYRDQGSDVNLCESCYARETRQQAEGQA